MKTIICLGNRFLYDDSIGIVLGYLIKKRNPNIKVEICETDFSYASLISRETNKIIIIDAINSTLLPGSSCAIPINEINQKYFLHHDLRPFIQNKDGYLYGIQFENITPKIGISNVLKLNLTKYLSDILKIYNSL